MGRLVQKVEWNLDGTQTQMYMYGEADFESNKAMQEPLEKLYQYETYENVECTTKMEDGVTICCGYDFGLDAFNRKIKLNYCPIYGKRLE